MLLEKTESDTLADILSVKSVSCAKLQSYAAAEVRRVRR